MACLNGARAEQVLGVSYTLPPGWNAKALGTSWKQVTPQVTLEGQDFNLSATPSPLLSGQPPLSGTLRVSRILHGAIGLTDCDLNQDYMRLVQKGSSDFKPSAPKDIQFPHMRGCVTEFVYTNQHIPTIPTMWGRIFSAQSGNHVIGMVIVSADHKTPAGVRSHLLRFKEMDDLLRSMTFK